MRALLLTAAFCLLGTLPTAFAQSAGKFGTAVDIHRTPLRTISLPSYGQFPITVEMWVRLSAEKKARFNLLASNAIDGSPAHWEIYSTPLDGLMTAKLSGFEPAIIPSFVRITDDRWHYLAMACDGTKVALFVDGEQVANRSLRRVAEPVPIAASGELFVGAQELYNAELVTPSLVDELRISNVLRTCDRLPVGPFEVDQHTVGLWRFDDPPGSSRSDLSRDRNSLAYSPGIEAAWTPRSSDRPDAEAWERETDDNWLDSRFNAMDKGGLLGVSMSIPSAPGRAPTAFVPQGLAISAGNQAQATVLFDRERLQMVAAWRGGFLHIPPRRFGLIQHPRADGTLLFSTLADTESLSAGSSRYEGLYRHGARTILSYQIDSARILDMPGVEQVNGLFAVTRSLRVQGGERRSRLRLAAAPPSAEPPYSFETNAGGIAQVLRWPASAAAETAGQPLAAIAVLTSGGQPQLSERDGQIVLELAGGQEQAVKLLYWSGSRAEWPQFDALLRGTELTEGLAELTTGSPRRWPDGPTTRLRQGVERPAASFILDTLELPHENAFGSVFRVTGLAFLPQGRIAICTIYGDVWIVSGVTGDSTELQWRRFAAGLYQPFGMAVRDGLIHVLERGQITCLHDLNNDGEADYYQNVYDGWDTTGDGHAYDTGLHLAPDDAFFFFKGQTGRPGSDESGTLIRVFPDGSGHEIFATGFRHPIGLGMSPAGDVTGADQQGNWMPATRIDWYRRGGFYGDMRTHHRAVPPDTYDPPICWLPRDVDNSASGQVWIPADQWGPLGGGLLHLSYGRCRVFLLLHEEVAGQVQGGVVRLPVEELSSGPITGSFSGHDGHLYLVGMHGWQSAAQEDGCLQRLRFTGRPVGIPIALHARQGQIELRFAEPLDRQIAADLNRYSVERWNYRYSASYGSDHWSVDDPQRMGHDSVQVKRVDVAENGRSVRLTINELSPVMQMKISFQLQAADGGRVVGDIHHTIHALGQR